MTSRALRMIKFGHASSPLDLRLKITPIGGDCHTDATLILFQFRKSLRGFTIQILPHSFWVGLLMPQYYYPLHVRVVTAL